MQGSREGAGALESAPARPDGVMDASYAAGRRRRPHLVFRLGSRAHEAVRAFRRHRASSGGEDPADPIALLDFGAADGATLALVHHALGAADSVGIEYAADLIAAAEVDAPGLRLVQGDVTRPHPEVAEASRDLVLALAVLEHLESPGLVFEQARRALRPGGLFVASCPVEFWDELSGSVGLHPDEHHELAFDRALFERLAREAGLEPVEYRRFMNAPIGFLPYLRIPVSPALAAQVDDALRACRIFDALFVNQLFVARRPA